MTTQGGSLCCQEKVAVFDKARNLPFITDHKGFKPMFLNPHVNVTYQYIYEDQGEYIDNTPTIE